MGKYRKCGKYCVYWNESRELFHVTKTERAVKYADIILRVGLSYDEADTIRREANDSFVKELYKDFGKEVI